MLELSLRDHDLADPKAAGQPDVDGAFVGESTRIIGRATHGEPAGRTPDELHLHAVVVANFARRASGLRRNGGRGRRRRRHLVRRVGNDRPHDFAQPREVRLKRLGECIELMWSAQVRRQDAGRNVLDAERDDGNFAFGRVLDFAEHAIRLVGRGRQDEHNGVALFDGLAARLVPTPSGDDIAR